MQGPKNDSPVTGLRLYLGLVPRRGRPKGGRTGESAGDKNQGKGLEEKGAPRAVEHGRSSDARPKRKSRREESRALDETDH